MTGWTTALAGRSLFDDERTALIRGDAVQVLRETPDESVDLILADPPYSSGGQFRGDRMGSTSQKYVSSDSGAQAIEDFTGDNRDQRAYFAWSSLWLAEAHRVLKPGRACCVFTDWRQMPTTTDALQAGGFVWRGVCIWDKVGGRPLLGIANGQAEYVVWGTKGPTDLGHEIYLPNILRFRVPTEERGLHQTPKPVELLARLCELAPPRGVVFDPFTGSGSALIAARRTGRRGVGVELSEAHAETALQRIRTESTQLDLLSEGEAA